MSVETTTCEDLKAFERRLTEVVGFMQPTVVRWRIILLVASICTATGAYFWLTDPDLKKITLFRSLTGHWFFVLSALILIALFAFGIHQKVVASSIIVNRLRNVLHDFSLSCDDCGKLILKPRPSNATH